MASKVLFFSAAKIKGGPDRTVYIIGSRDGSLIISDSSAPKAVHLSYAEDDPAPMEITPHVSTKEIFIPVANSSKKLTIYQYNLDDYQLIPKLVLQIPNAVTTARFLHSNPLGGAGAFLGGALIGGLLATTLFAPALTSRNPGHSITNRLIFISANTFSYGVTVKSETGSQIEEMEQIVSVPVSKWGLPGYSFSDCYPVSNQLHLVALRDNRGLNEPRVGYYLPNTQEAGLLRDVYGDRLDLNPYNNWLAVHNNFKHYVTMYHYFKGDLQPKYRINLIDSLVANTFIHCTKVGLKHFAVSVGQQTLDVYNLDGSLATRINQVEKFDWIQDLLEYITIADKNYAIKEAKF